MRCFSIIFVVALSVLYCASSGATLPSIEECERLLFDRTQITKDHLLPLAQLPLALAGRTEASILLRLSESPTPRGYHAPLKFTLEHPDLYTHDLIIQTAEGQYAVLQGTSEDLIAHARYLLAHSARPEVRFEVLDPAARPLRWGQRPLLFTLTDSIEHDVIELMNSFRISAAKINDPARGQTYYAFNLPELSDDENLISVGVDVLPEFDAAKLGAGAHAWHAGLITILSTQALDKLHALDRELSMSRTPVAPQFVAALGLELGEWSADEPAFADTPIDSNHLRHFTSAPPPVNVRIDHQISATHSPAYSSAPVIVGAVERRDLCVIELNHKVTTIQTMPTIDEITKRAIVLSLELSGGRRTKAAKALGMPRSTFYRYLNVYGLIAPSAPAVEDQADDAAESTAPELPLEELIPADN